ncbi:MAG TPA: OmpA family protein [Oligoflexus sp.]|uniref:OmpA/MotB family protein n=1 Tax=Oligoflexus sp. TaxID=1971216 RepID=UPI002D68AADF|nr:OmpA family protein [Oligoflexus sp.]HYX37348.1 OmpA family protein [Oligoflexus sp.]
MAEFDSANPPRIKLKKKEALWLYSLTDLTFILMAFFALMLSMSKPDQQQFDAVASAVQPQNPASEKATNLTVIAEDLERVIKQLKLEEDARVQIDANGLLLEFSENLVFSSGSAQTGAAFATTTEKILRILSRTPDRYQVIVEGHTDDLPIQSRQFKSNWELSSARGIALLKTLQQRGLNENRMRVLAVAHTQPKVPIEGKTGQSLKDARKANRRVVIRLD